MAGREFWGADIGGWSVKGVKLRRVGDALELAAADVVPLQGEAVPEVSFGRDKRIWEALGELVRRNNVRNEPLVICVPARATFVRPFDLVIVSGKAAEQLIRFEIQQHLPFSLDTVIWDYDLFPPEQADDQRREGIMFAVKKEVLSNYAMSLSAAGLHADDIQVAPLALYNFLKYDRQIEEPALILDIGATSTDMVMMHDGRYAVSSIPFGGDVITRAIQERFHLTPEKAERAKLNVGKLRMAKQVLEAMLPAMRRYASEVKNAVRRLRSEADDTRPKKALVFGGAADTVGLTTFLSKALECDVEVPKGLQRITIGDEVDREFVETHFSELGVALGLAVQAAGEGTSHISLISATATRRKIASRSLPFVAATLGVVAAMQASLIFLGDLRARKLEIADAALKEALQPVEEMRTEWGKLGAPSPSQKRLAEYEKLGRYRLGWLRVTSQVGSILPTVNRNRGRENEKIWLIKLTLENKEKGKPNLLQGVSWWGIVARGQREDYDFANKNLVEKIQALQGFTNVTMTVKGGAISYRVSKRLVADAPAEENGAYWVFPVTFEVNLDSVTETRS